VVIGVDVAAAAAVIGTVTASAGVNVHGRLQRSRRIRRPIQRRRERA